MSSLIFWRMPSSSPDVSLIEANLFGPEAFQHMVRRMVLGPAWLLLTNVPLLFLLLGMLKKEFDSSVSAIAALYLFRAFVWGLVLIVVFPVWLRYMMARNLPFFAAYVSLLCVVLALSNLVTWYLQPNLDPLFLMGRFLRQVLSGAVLAAALVLVSERSIRSLGADASLVPVWWPTKSRPIAEAITPQQTVADISLFDPDLSGRIFSIQARNQYVEVQTRDKLHLLRMPFSSALARLPQAAGCRIHRSWWVAFDVPHNLRRNGQSFEVLDAAGRAFPVSRPNIEIVRGLVERNNPSN